MATERASNKQTPLSVIDRENADKTSERQDGNMAESERDTTVAQLRETLRGLRSQVEQLSQSVAEIGGKAGKSVVNTVTSGKESAVATVETHPFYAILAASAAAFLLGRMSVAPERGVAERTYDRLHDLALRLEPRVSEALRSRMR